MSAILGMPQIDVPQADGRRELHGRRWSPERMSSFVLDERRLPTVHSRRTKEYWAAS